MLKRLALCLALLCGLAAAQVTVIPLNQSGPAHFFKGKGWIFTANPGVAFTWSPLAGSNYACVQIVSNNPTSSHTANFQAFMSPDPNANVFNILTSNPSRFSLRYSIAAATWGVSTQQGSVLESSFNISGGVLGELLVYGGGSATGSPDTFDILEVDSQTPCANTDTLAINGVVPGSRPCNNTWTGTATTGTQTVISASTAFGNAGALLMFPRWHICSYVFSGATTVTSAPLSINIGSSATACAAALTSGNAWSVTPGATSPVNFTSAGAPEVFTFNGPNALCFSNGGTGATETLSISYDYW